MTLEDVQGLAGGRRLSLLQKLQGETLPVLPSLVEQSMIQCLVLCVVDTVIPVVSLLMSFKFCVLTLWMCNLQKNIA